MSSVGRRSCRPRFTWHSHMWCQVTIRCLEMVEMRAGWSSTHPTYLYQPCCDWNIYDNVLIALTHKDGFLQYQPRSQTKMPPIPSIIMTWYEDKTTIIGFCIRLNKYLADCRLPFDNRWYENITPRSLSVRASEQAFTPTRQARLHVSRCFKVFFVVVG